MNTLPSTTEKSERSLKVAVILFFTLLFPFMVLLSHVVYSPVLHTFQKFRPGSEGGDDAHYLLMVSSLLFDGDLQLQRDYERVREGGWEAGYRQRWRALKHHTLLVDPGTREHHYFSRVFQWSPARSCVGEACRDYLRESNLFSNPDDVVEYPAHPPGFPLIMAGLLYPSFPSVEQTETRMNLVMIFISWLGALLVYLTARRLGLSVKYAWIAALVLALASPWLPYSRSFFSEPTSGVILMAGLWAMATRRPFWAGVACVAAFATKLPYILVGVGWALELCRTRRFRDALVLSSVMGAGAGALCLASYGWTGAFMIGGHIDPSLIWGPFRPLRTMLDIQYGLLPFAPWAALSLFAVGKSPFVLQGRIRLWRKKGGFRGISCTKSLPISDFQEEEPVSFMFFPILFYWILLAFHRPLGEICYGPRYWIPFLPWLALAATVYAARGAKAVRLILYYLALLGAAAALPAALTYPHAWNQPPHVPLAWMLGI